MGYNLALFGLLGRSMGWVILQSLQKIGDWSALIAALVDAGEKWELIGGDTTGL